MTPVIRLDSLPITDKTFFTSEGYFRDSPILTSTGIFEYTNSEEVFDTESLLSYQGKPIIITHDAGLIDKRNVDKEQIGTILTSGYEDGDNVRADIVIHNTDAMKKSHLRELSVGYSLDLEEKEGMWNGQHYDAIQRNIRVNHLALVRKARAGDQARLNLDSRDTTNTLKGGKNVMAIKKKSNFDGVLSPEELEKAIADYRAKRDDTAEKNTDTEIGAETKTAETNGGDASNAPKNATAGNGTSAPETEKTEKTSDTDGEDDVATVAENAPVENKVAAIKEHSENKDDDATPQSVIKQQIYDIEQLLNIIDSLLAEREFNKTGVSNAGADNGGSIVKDEDDVGDNKNLAADEGLCSDKETCDADDNAAPEQPDSDKIGNADDGEETTTEGSPKMNTDSVDRIIRKRVKLGMIGGILNLDGLEDMSIRKAEKLVIQAVRPTVRLDGKSNAYIDAMFDCACDEIKARAAKDTAYQKKQMFNMDGINRANKEDSSMSARDRMIERQHAKNKEVK